MWYDVTSPGSSSNTDAAVENIPSGGSSKHQSPEASVPETRCEKWTVERKTDRTEPAMSRTRSKPTVKAPHQDVLTSGKLKTPKDSSSKALLPPAPHPSLRPAGQASLGEVHHRGLTDAHVTLRNQGREVYLRGVDTGKADDPLASQRTPTLLQETPVRDGGQSDWSNPAPGDVFVPLRPYHSRRTEPLLPLSAASSDLREFGSLTADHSDMTVYQEIVNMPPHTKALTLPSVLGSAHREPVPVSEGEKLAPLCSKSLFPELNLCQQDSGFNSPFTIRK